MKIIMYTKKNFFGTMARSIMVSLFEFNNNLIIRQNAFDVYQAVMDLKKNNDDDADIYIFAGLDYKEGSLVLHGLDQWMRDCVENPFTQVIHVAEHGDKMENYLSEVIDDTSFVKTLLKVLEELGSEWVGSIFEDKHPLRVIIDLAEVVNTYYNYWTDSTESFSRALDLQELYLAYHEHLPEMIRGLSMDEIEDKFKSYFYFRLEYRQEYIAHAIKNARYGKVPDEHLKIITVCTELYRNEVAHELLNESKEEHTAVFLLSPTSVNDMILVRTKGVPAQSFCDLLSGGQGKGNEHAGYFFTNTSWCKTLTDSFIRFMNE